MPTAQYGHDSEPEAQERTDDHDYKRRVVHEVSYHHHTTGSKRGDSIKISPEHCRSLVNENVT
jgi:hypothetical protein